MPVNSKAKDVSQMSDYIKRKSAYLKDIKLLIDEERAAIEALDVEKLNVVIGKMEEALSKIETLDNQQEDSGVDQLSAHERDVILKALEQISGEGDKNLKLLLKRREETLAQLKELRIKKDAHKAYNRPQAVRSVVNKNS
ncbi:MAG: hypothetical protein K6T91_00740 [Firmicutes bacterium]|nr:hypothetical protein [Bacillota bacterium]